jgi:hypothetical protein
VEITEAQRDGKAPIHTFGALKALFDAIHGPPPAADASTGKPKGPKGPKGPKPRLAEQDAAAAEVTTPGETPAAMAPESSGPPAEAAVPQDVLPAAEEPGTAATDPPTDER